LPPARCSDRAGCRRRGRWERVSGPARHCRRCRRCHHCRHCAQSLMLSPPRPPPPSPPPTQRQQAGAPPLRTQWPGLRAGGPPPAPRRTRARSLPAGSEYRRAVLTSAVPVPKGPAARWRGMNKRRRRRWRPGRNQRPKHSRWAAAPPGGRRAGPCGGELSAQANNTAAAAAAATSRKEP
jgi:hypothetical protein